MTDEKEINELLEIATAANLDGLDFLSQFTKAQLADGYNGIGPEFLKPKVRAAVSEFLHIFKPAAVVHDLRNEMSDGTRKGFKYANDEFLRNCLKLADYYYKGKDARRHLRARAAAKVLYAFVSAEHFGWRAWLEAKERHAAKTISDNSVWKKKEANMKKLMIILAAGAAILMTGCTVTKIDYEKDEKGVTSYRIYHNDHWLKRDTGAMSGGMTNDGKFEVKLEKAEASPSEEFNRSMQTYMTAFVQMMQIAAAAYNPSASGASVAKSADAATPQTTVVNVQPAAETATATATDATAQKSESCADGSCTTGACTDGSCTP